MQQQASSHQNQQKRYFNLKTTGLGYVNDIRDVEGGKGRGRKGTPNLWCRVSALRGAVESPAYSRFDCSVTGAVAQQVIRDCQQAEMAGKKVLVSFRMGDGYADPFIYKSGERKGEPGAIIKARLLAINWVKIDGKEVWRAAPSNRPAEGDNHESPPADEGESSDDSAS